MGKIDNKYFVADKRPHASYLTDLTTHVVEAFVWWKMNSSHKKQHRKKVQK